MEQVLGSDHRGNIFNTSMDPTREYGYMILDTRPERLGVESAVVLANIKDDIGHFEARCIIKVLKNCVPREYLVFWETHI